MTIASGIATRVCYKKQSTAHTAPGATDAQEIRRTDFTINLGKDTYQSAEKVAHTQISDFRHGVRRVPGTLNGELSPGAYIDLMGSALRRDFTAGESVTLSDVTAAAGPPGTFTTAAGNFITSGFKVGDVVRWTGWTSTAIANNSRNYRITALTTTVMTVGTAASGASTQPEAVIAATAGDSVTCAVVGQKSWIPLTSHTSDAYAFEKWFADIEQSELYLDVRISSMRVQLPATGMATISFTMVGIDMTTGTAAYFTSPTAPTTLGLTAAVNGFLRVGAADLAVVTGADFTLDLGVAGDPVVGSNTIPSLSYGRAQVSGQIVAAFEDATLRDLFIDETESAISLVLTTNNDIDADFLAFNFSRVKFGGADKSDPDGQITATMTFTALIDNDGGSAADTEKTTLSIQDSSAA